MPGCTLDREYLRVAPDVAGRQAGWKGAWGPDAAKGETLRNEITGLDGGFGVKH